MAEDQDDLPDQTAAGLGARVRRLREEAELTLEQLADAAGVSRAMLSKVERGEKSPTLTIVSRIAKGFNISISQLLGEKVDGSDATLSVVRRADRFVFTDAENGFERHMLAPVHAGNGLELVMHVIPPHTTAGTFPPYSGRASKHIVVEEGVLTLKVGGKEIALSVGDALFFEIHTPYEFINRGPVRCSYYVFISRTPR